MAQSIGGNSMADDRKIEHDRRNEYDRQMKDAEARPDVEGHRLMLNEEADEDSGDGRKIKDDGEGRRN
jgi:hypothetical protein